MKRCLLTALLLMCFGGCSDEGGPAFSLSEDWKEFDQLKAEDGMHSIDRALKMAYRGGAIQHVKSETFQNVVEQLERSVPPTQITSIQREELVGKLGALRQAAQGKALSFDDKLVAVRADIEQMEQSYVAAKVREAASQPHGKPSAFEYWRGVFFGAKD